MTTHPIRTRHHGRLTTLARGLALASLIAATPLAADVPTFDRGTLVRATPGVSPLLWALPYNQADGDALANALAAGEADSRAQVAAESLARAAGVYADLSKLDATDSGRHAMLQGALDAGVPLLLEGDADGAGIEAITGVGFGIEPDGAAWIQRVGANRYALIKLGVTGETREQSARVAVPTNKETPLAHQGSSEATTRAVTGTATIDPVAVAAAVTALLDNPRDLEDAVAHMMVKSADANPECPVSSCKQWIFISAGLTGSNQLSVQWTAKAGKQYPFIEISFVVTLHDSVNPDFKALTIYTTGEQGPTPAYFGTGGMYKNGDHFRGFFNEKMEITTDLMTSSGSNVSLGATSPGNTNNESTVITSNSFTVGADSDGANGSYTAGWSYSRDIADFEINNKSNPFGGFGLGRAKWNYKLSASDGSDYDEPKDLLDDWSFDCDLHGLGSIARNNLQAATLSTWNAPGDFAGTATFQLMAYQKVRRVKSDQTWYGACELEWKWKSKTIWAILSVDFDAVNQ